MRTIRTLSGLLLFAGGSLLSGCQTKDIVKGGMK